MSQPSKRTIVVGDVHGCADELDALLVACRYTAADRLILAGDLVAKGPDSARVLRRVRELKAEAVRGNHDEQVLRWYRATPAERQTLTFKSSHRQVIDTLEDEDWALLNALPLWLRVPEHRLLVLHGGLMPGVPLEAQKREHLLNLRGVTSDGSPSMRADEGVPWASLWEGPETVVFGHDAVRGLQRHPFAFGLDSGCVYGRKLSAVVFPQRELFQVPAARAYA